MDKLERDAVFTAEGREMVMVNERPVPLASMGAVLDVPSLNAGEDILQVLTLQATDRMVAFEVDELYSEEELVLKPLGPELARAPYVAGAALLGTGEVIIVIDANDLVRRATGASLPHRSAAYVLPSLTQRRLRVLVVDDSITTRTLEKNILETAGFDVHVAMNGVEAWEMLAETEFDIVISDVEMPRMTGLELTARIKSSSLYRHIPVILLTSLAKPEQREAGLRAGADAYLVKSRFDQNELLQTIQTVV
jgi:two-component system chemotaxis sensor kinase CheA